MLAASELPALLQQYYWPFVRMSALFLAAPILGASTFPVRARILLALGATFLIAPAIPAVAQVDVLSVAGLLLGLQQVVIGLAMGFIVQLVFAAAVIAGQSLAMTMGLGFAMSVDPQNGVQVPVLSQLYVILATLIFLAVDGHLMLIGALANSFTLLPVALHAFRDTFALDIALLGSQMFVSALLIALPALTAVLLINLAFGVITRAAPQLNIFAVGFPVTIFAGFVFILLTMPSVFSLFLQMFESGLTEALGLVR